MFSVVANIYNKKTKGPTLMELFTATATQASTCWSLCGRNLNIVSMCAVSPVVHTSKISSCQKKNFFSFPVTVNNSLR